MSTLAAFGVAMTQLRRIPAIVGQVLGAGGGGESTGAWQPKSSGLKLPSGGSGGGGGSGSNGGGGPTVRQEIKNKAITAAATAVGGPKGAITARAIQERKSLPSSK